MDVQLLAVSRLQFAITAAFHMIFPAITVGLSLFLVFLYGAYLRTNKEIYLTTYHFWRNIFAVGFGIGVVAGIVMTFEFGLNWAAYANAVGPIVGVIISMEVVTAFFLEAGVMGVLLYGEGRVSKPVMFLANCMVALGTLLSTTWILSANSWMQTPAGYTLVNGQFRPTDWIVAIFNPSFAYRFPHVLLGVLLSASFVMTGTAAWYLLKRQHLEFARLTISLGLGVMSLLIPLQLYMGDTVASEMGQFQAPKLLALEGNWDSTNTGYNVFIIPNQDEQRNIVQVSIPCLGSIILNRDFTCSKPVPGLKQVPPALQPPMVLVFYGFRLMFYISILIFFAVASSLLLRLRGRLYTARWFHRFMLILFPVGILAVIGGWITAETGRQPYVVYGKLTTTAAVSPLAPGVVVASLSAFIVVYLALLTLYIAYLVRAIRRGPGDTPLLSPARITQDRPTIVSAVDAS
ncbi:cytochrome ubiquinol oxidase subunit I [Dictyobacter formicarum]|uniref:Cytochrome ubiquinol oxidase subunit I n=1 Tax=Dictyobacter formicarum TaxID=2778368 RepID=A0ABQ3VA47_9CHLR|nr:cytochrome ubiquinol oxidase subunit I [Dictyobacter formicarum]GHO82678.1 cytochrome ubiquinol oxidase subunit I [Dictyobacter formicarum]